MDLRSQDVISAVQRSDVSWLSHHTDSCAEWLEFSHKKSGDTVLHIAATTGSLPVMRWLLQHGCGCYIDHRNTDGKTPLHSAAQASHTDMVALLLQQGAEVDSLKRADWTPLMLAATRTNIEVVRLLLAAGADPSLVNKDGWSTLHVASREGNIQVVQKILTQDAALFNNVSNNGRTPFHTAALHGHTAVVELLLKYGEVCDDGDACGSTPVMEALRGGHLDTAKVLLSAGASLTARDAIGRTTLHLAAEAGQVQVVNFLVNVHKMDVNATSNTGLTCVHYGAREGQCEVVKELVALGAMVNSKDQNGRTALWLACGGRKQECAQVLVELGAQDIKDNHGTLPSSLMTLIMT